MGNVITAHPLWSPIIGQPTEAYWGQRVAEGVVQRFATIAERDARWQGTASNPIPNGAVCVVVTGAANIGNYSMWQRRGSAWTKIGPSILAAPHTGAQAIAGALSVSGMLTLPATKATHPQHAANKAYVDQQDGLLVRKTGSTMTGPLTLKDAPTHSEHAVRKGYVDGGLNSKLDLGDGGRVKRSVTIGHEPSEGPGIKLWADEKTPVNTSDGGVISTAVSKKDLINLRMRRGPEADMKEQPYIWFGAGQAPGHHVARIQMNNDLNGVAFINCKVFAPSDYRLKEQVGPITDAAERVRTLAARAFRGRWRDAPDVEADMLAADDIAAVAPYAVMGEKDAVTDEGEIEPQRVDFVALVPMLVSALGDALDRLGKLEARLA